MSKVDVTLSISSGEFRTFGAFGPAYEVLEVRCSSANHTNDVLRVRVLETGEELDYPVSRAIKDPEAA